MKIYPVPIVAFLLGMSLMRVIDTPNPDIHTATPIADDSYTFHPEKLNGRPILSADAQPCKPLSAAVNCIGPLPDHPTNPSIGGYILESPDHAKERLEISPTSSDHATYRWQVPPWAKTVEITIYGAGSIGSVYAEPKGQPR